MPYTANKTIGQLDTLDNTTLANGDLAVVGDVSDSNRAKGITWTNLKAFLKTYFDTQYPSGSGTSTGANTGDQTITLTGDVTGAGTGSFATTIGALKVLGSMIANTTIDLVTKVTGTLPVSNGGTGVATLGDAGVLIGNGTGAVQVTGAGTSGQVLTSNGVGVDPTFQAPVGFTSKARAWSNAGMAAASGARVLTFDTESYDVDNEFDLTTERFTAKVTGYYLVTACVRVGAATDQNIYSLLIYKNATLYTTGRVTASGTGSFQITASDIIPLAVNDFIEMRIDFQTSVAVDGSETFTYVSIHRLS